MRLATAGALAVLLVLLFCGELLAKWLELPLPGGLVGMLLLLGWLLMRRRASLGMQQASQVLLQNLMLLFIPFIAGIVAQIDYIRTEWLAFIAACVLGAVASLAVTAWTLRWMLALVERRKPGEGGSNV